MIITAVIVKLSRNGKKVNQDDQQTLKPEKRPSNNTKYSYNIVVMLHLNILVQYCSNISGIFLYPTQKIFECHVCGILSCNIFVIFQCNETLHM